MYINMLPYLAANLYTADSEGRGPAVDAIQISSEARDPITHRAVEKAESTLQSRACGDALRTFGKVLDE